MPHNLVSAFHRRGAGTCRTLSGALLRRQASEELALGTRSRIDAVQGRFERSAREYSVSMHSSSSALH
jgi:hypothetical protein